MNVQPTQLPDLAHYRVSKHILLSDLCWPAACTFGNAHLGHRHILKIFEPHRLHEATQLAERTLEPLITKFGPISIAAGFDPSTKPSTPHSYLPEAGAAVDLAVHDWVNPTSANPTGRAPIGLVPKTIKEGIPFSRFISYAGSEFVCLSHRSRGGFGRVYENVRCPMTPMDKPKFVTHSRGPDMLSSMEIVDRPGWRRAENEPIYHTQRSLRSQHIRVGHYFTALDFCRSSTALVHGIYNWIPADSTHHAVTVARMVAEVLDPLVAKLGMVSVIRGFENRGVRAIQSRKLERAVATATPDAMLPSYEAEHDWSNPQHAVVRVVLVTKQGTTPDEVRDALQMTNDTLPNHNGRVTFYTLPNGDLAVGLRVAKFTPKTIWTSAVR